MLLVIAFGAFATDPDTTKIKLKKDDPILVALDSMVTAKFFKKSNFTTDVNVLNKRKYKPDEVPVFDKAHYIKELKELDKNSPFDLVYNESVKAYIDAYTVRHRDKVSRLLGMAEFYFPLFEETLARYNLPLELKYLAIIESALNPNAQSSSGALGLWQFMYRTGKIYDLDATSYLDDRKDPYKSTVAACEYFKFLYGMFGDWQMVLAAYNGGPGTLLKAIRRSGGKRDYWEVRPYLTQETQGYVPAFIAVNYVMTHAADHNIYPEKPLYMSYELDSVIIRKHTNLMTLASVLQIPYDHIEFLNPIYKQPIIPETKDGLPLVLPKKKIGLYLSNQDAFYEVGEPRVNQAFEKQAELMTEVQKTHRVKSGDNLSNIAARYRVSVADLRAWNNIKGNLIHVGDNLKIKTLTASKPSSSAGATVSERPEGASRYYVVKAGDTLWEIAKKNELTLAQLKEMNDLSDSYVLKIGAKLKVQ